MDYLEEIGVGQDFKITAITEDEPLLGEDIPDTLKAGLLLLMSQHKIISFSLERISE